MRPTAAVATPAGVSPASVSTSAGTIATMRRPATSRDIASPTWRASTGPVTPSSASRSRDASPPATRSSAARPSKDARSWRIGRFAKVRVTGGPACARLDGSFGHRGIEDGRVVDAWHGLRRGRPGENRQEGGQQ